jgi:hypothetical protein
MARALHVPLTLIGVTDQSVQGCVGFAKSPSGWKSAYYY